MLKRVIALLVILIWSLNQMTSLSSSSLELKELITIEVKGEVNNPGLFEIQRDATFDDLLNQLDLKENADLDAISLNKSFIHEEVLVIPLKHSNKISINSASLEELIELKGIGEKTALAIIEYRSQNHGFKSLKDLMNVKGIGEKKYEAIKDDICL